jgi:hypothetical protein
MEKESIVVIRLGFLAFNIRGLWCFKFIYFLRKYEEKKAHNM